MFVNDKNITCENEDAGRCLLTVQSATQTSGSYTAPESILNDQTICVKVQDTDSVNQDYIVEVDEYQITNAVFNSTGKCLSFAIDRTFAHGLYNVIILKKVNGQYLPLQNDGGQTTIYIPVLSSYTVDFINQGTLTISDTNLAADIEENY